MPVDKPELELTQLVSLVKASRRSGIGGTEGTWDEFTKTLDAFVASLYTLERGGGGGGDADGSVQCGDRHGSTSSDGGAIASPGAVKETQRFLRRYYKRLATDQQERALRQQYRETAEAVLSSLSASESATVDRNSMVAVLTHRTMTHPKYGVLYKFPSHNKGWIRMARGLPSPDTPPILLAMDTESCTTDVETSSICSVCIVDDHGKSVYKALIKPKGQVLDYRTALTGLEEKDFEGVSLTRGGARKAVRRVLKSHPGAILVGHALHHDLEALRIDFAPVIDTALLFSYKDLPDCTPALKDLAKMLLNLDMRTAEDGHHDAEEDAAATMKVLMYDIHRGRPSPPLKAPEIKVPKELLNKLLIHSIPKDVDEAQLRALFQSDSTCCSGLQRFDGDLTTARKIFVVFDSPAGANNAFKKLKGEAEVDSQGRAMKKVDIPGPASRSVRIRKMACHNGLAFGRVPAWQMKKDEKRKEERKQMMKRRREEKAATKGAKDKGARDKGAKDKALRVKDRVIKRTPSVRIINPTKAGEAGTSKRAPIVCASPAKRAPILARAATSLPSSTGTVDVVPKSNGQAPPAETATPTDAPRPARAPLFAAAPSNKRPSKPGHTSPKDEKKGGRAGLRSGTPNNDLSSGAAAVGKKAADAEGAGGKKAADAEGAGGKKAADAGGAGGKKAADAGGAGGKKAADAEGAGGKKAADAGGAGGKKAADAGGAGGKKAADAGGAGGKKAADAGGAGGKKAADAGGAGGKKAADAEGAGGKKAADAGGAGGKKAADAGGAGGKKAADAGGAGGKKAADAGGASKAGPERKRKLEKSEKEEGKKGKKKKGGSGEGGVKGAESKSEKGQSEKGAKDKKRRPGGPSKEKMKERQRIKREKAEAAAQAKAVDQE